MKYDILIFVLVALAFCANAEPEPAKDQLRVFQRFRSAGNAQEARNVEADIDKNDTDADDDDDDDFSDDATPKRSSNPSSGRLFFKRFFGNNLFAQQQQQAPVIPIIITGAGAYTTPTSPVTTPTTSTTPTATSAAATSPATGTAAAATSPATGTAAAATGTATAAGRREVLKRQNEMAAAAAAVNDEQQLQTAYGAGAQEYVVTDQQIRGTSDAKASKGPARVNLRRSGAKNGQVISVRIPARYRNYFKNGQRVMLNTNRRRPAKRRVVQRRRVNNYRRRRVGNKRRRVNN